MHARFCISEAGLPLPLPELEDDAADELAAVLERFTERLSRCREDGQEVARWSQFDFIEVAPGLRMDQLLYQEGVLDRAQRLLLMEALRHCVLWDDGEQGVDPLAPITVGGDEVWAPSVAWAHAQHGAGRAVACLPLAAEPAGPIAVCAAGKTRTIFFLGHRAGGDDPWLAFYRSVPEVEDHDEDTYLVLAPLLFPALHFKAGIARELRRFDGDFPSLRVEVTRHLAALNDHFRAVFTAHRGEPRRVEAEMRARCEVTLSPESGNTKANRAAWAERKIVIDGRELHCDWHTKLAPHKNRIHFHPGDRDVAGGKIIIGIFHEHLSL